MENKIWNSLSDEDRKEVVEYYNSQEKIIKGNLTENSMIAKGAIIALNEIFGKENLNPQPPIKTWEDIEKHCPMYKNLTPFTDLICSDALYNKLVATYKISLLIRFGYGGEVTDEEWNDPSKEIFVIIQYDNRLDKVNTYNCTKDFIAFHTEKQRDEFFKNHEQLCKDYYMI